MSDTSTTTIREVLWDMRETLNLLRADLDSERWQHFIQWDIIESLEESYKWLKECYDELDNITSQPSVNKEECKDEDKEIRILRQN